MINFAFLLGVSEYANADNLDACKKDVELMCQLLEATNKYKVVRLDEKSNSRQALEGIEAALAEDSGQDVGEVFFYFSGHGGLNFGTDDESVLWLTDTAEGQINSTALKHSELDAIIRAKNPKVYVKVVDACNSGIPYIKSHNATSVSNSSAHEIKGINDVYFMSSSKITQYSYAPKNGGYSYFTKAFVDSVAANAKTTIRYSEIQNRIRDKFLANTEQEPQFTNQGDLRAVFSEPTEALLTFAGQFNKTSIPEENKTNVLVEQSSKVDSYLARYRTLDAVKVIFEEIEKINTETTAPQSWFTNYYEFSYISNGYDSYSEEPAIVKFLYDRRNTERLHVTVETGAEDVKSSMGYLWNSTRTIPVSYSSATNYRDLPNAHTFRFTPKNDGLPKYILHMVFIFSDTYFYILTATKEHAFKGWSDEFVNTKTKYTYKKIDYCEYSNEQWLDFINSRIIESVGFIENSLVKFVE